MLIYFNYVMCLNSKKIDKTNKTLLDLRARCVGKQIELPEAESSPETHSVKGQVSNTSVEENIFSVSKGRLNNAGLDMWCSKNLSN